MTEWLNDNRKLDIGGDFEFSYSPSASQENFESSFCLNSSHRYFATGRVALAYVIDKIDITGEVFLAPSYYCHESFPSVEDLEVRLYNVKPDLTPDFADVDKSKVGAVLIVNYFGISALDGTAIRELFPEAIIILDNSQAFYSLEACGKKGDWADWQLFSPRKFFSLPDGAILLGPDELRSPHEYTEKEWTLSLWLVAVATKALFRAGGCLDKSLEKDYLENFEQYSTALHKDSKLMSYLSKAMLDCIPFDQIAKRRRENFDFLYRELGGLSDISAVFGRCPTDVPLCLPILVPKGSRKSLLEYLKLKRIFCPVHWPGSELTSGIKNFDGISEALSIPIDQRYDVEDMTRTYEAVKSFYG